MRSYLSPLLFITLFTSVITAASIPLFSWHGDYTTDETLEIGGTLIVEGEVARLAYSWENPMSPSTGYHGPAFYGTIEARAGITSEGDPNFALWRLRRQNGISRIQIGTVGVGPAEGESAATAPRGTVHGLIFFKKEEFLGGGASGDSLVRFDSDSSMSLNIPSFSNSPRSGRMAVHALVDGDWNWYLSEQGTAPAGIGLFTIDHAGEASWGLWDDVSGTDILPSLPVSYGVLGSEFEDINAVGYYFYATHNSVNGAEPLVFLESFSVSAVVIPEVTHISLAAGVLLFMLWLRKRRRV